MKSEHVLARLGEHQRAILAHLDRCEALIAEGPEAARARLAGARLEMFRLIRVYQLFKHVEIFDPIIGRGNFHQIAHATRLKAQCIAVTDVYRTHVHVWTVRDVAADWARYVQAEAGIGGKARAHMATEAIEVRRLVAASPDRASRPVDPKPPKISRMA